jgi:hypothetical protein
MSLLLNLRRSSAGLVLALLGAICSVALSGGWLSEAFASLEPDLRYGLPTVLLLAVAAVLCAIWPRPALPDRMPSPRAGTAFALLAGGLGLSACAMAVNLMLPAVFASRINAMQADMLVVIDLGVRRFLTGANPYAIYRVPWEVPLPYGPYLWGPFVIPVALNADLRILTLITLLTVPASCIWAAAVCARTGRLAPAALFTVLGAAIVFQPAVQHFFVIGHTQVYWPLLVIFAWLLSAERWTAAALALGCLVVARTTMVSLVPVFVMFLWHRQLLTMRRAIALLGAIVIPFVPFAIADPAALWYALYGSYQKVMKEVVWRTQWAHYTIGLTGFLLRHGMQRYAELTQAAALAVVYIAAWRRLARGARPEPWLALALLVFSMTSLWPVIYVYFDVFVLIAATLASSVLVQSQSVRDFASGLAVIVVCSMALVLSAATRQAGIAPEVDVGTPAAAPLTAHGFDGAQVEEGRTYATVHEQVGTVRIPRASRSAASIHVIAKGCSPHSAVLRLEALLNGHPLGSTVIRDDWKETVFTASSRAWYYGVNALELRFTVPLAAAPDAKTDARSCVAAIDRVTVQP